MTKEYLPNLFAEAKWNDLSESEKRQFGLAFIDKASVCSEAEEQLETLYRTGGGESYYFSKRMNEISEYSSI
jgi:hypothetical protein